MSSTTPAQVPPSKPEGTQAEEAQDDEDQTPKGWRFWIVFLSCCFLALLVSLDGTVVVIALPRIVNELLIGDDYVWVANSFWLAGTVFQPLCAQISDIFGRKAPILTSIAIFFVGGVVSGTAVSGRALIAGRAVQGLGSGGIMLLMEVIVCDIVSLRERGKYLSIVLSTAAIGAIVGPVIGGAIADRNWRWIFYMNLPTSGAVFFITAFLMPLRYTKDPSWRNALSRIDWLGSVIFVGSVTSLLLGLIFGGILFPWRSWHIVVPLVLGALGWVGFHVFENFCSNPAVPRRLFGNRTSVGGFAMVFLQSMITTWVAFEWPAYFQGVLQTSPLKAGINYLAFEAFLIPAAAISGSLVSRTGLFRPYQFFGFSLLTLGAGLNVLLDRETSTVKWVVLIAINAVGLGSLLPTMLPAILASLPEEDVALATGIYSFLRSFGYIWGATIPAVILNACYNRYSWQISDTTVQQRLGQGKAYQYLSGEYIKSLPSAVRVEVVDVYVQSLRVGWEVSAAFAFIGILLVLVEKHIPLRTKLNTQFGLKAQSQVKKGAGQGCI